MLPYATQVYVEPMLCEIAWSAATSLKERLVLLYLGLHADRDMPCLAGGLDRLEMACGLSERSASRILRSLAKRGIVGLEVFDGRIVQVWWGNVLRDDATRERYRRQVLHVQPAVMS